MISTRKYGINADYNYIIVGPNNITHLNNIRNQTVSVINPEYQNRVHFMLIDLVSEFLDSILNQINTSNLSNNVRIKGYRVKLNFPDMNAQSDQLNIKNSILKIISNIKKDGNK